MPRPNVPATPPGAGLCGGCAHAREQRGARGSSFLRCALADLDPEWARYPRLPVRECRGHRPAQAPDTEAEPRC